MGAFQRGRDRVVLALVSSAVARPWLTLMLATLAAIGTVSYAATSLEVSTDRNALIREGRDWNQRFTAYREDFEGTRDLIVVLQGPPRMRSAYADALAQRVATWEHVTHVFHRLDTDRLEQGSLLYLDEASLNELRSDLETRGEDLAELTASPSLDRMLRFVDRQISRALVGHLVSDLFGSAPDPREREPVDLSLLISLLEDLSAVVDGEQPEAHAWSSSFGASGRTPDGTLRSKDGTMTFVILSPVDGTERKVMDALDGAFGRLRAEFPEVEAGVTGQRAINAEEMRATVRDTKRAGIVALIGVAFVFAVGFGRLRHPLMAVVALVYGIAWSAGATTLFVGHLTVLSVGFTSILIGLGVDFGIHVVSRFEEARVQGHAEPVLRAARLSGPGNVAGALTTALAFYGVGLSDFLGVAELGIIAGSGVLLCLLASLTVLPALLSLSESAGRDRAWSAGFLRPLTRTPVALGGLALAAVGYAAAPLVKFDSNLLNLQVEGAESVELELKLVGGEGEGSAFAVVTAPSLAEARRLADAIEALSDVSEVDSLARVVPPDQDARARRARSLAPLVNDLRTDGTFDEPTSVDRVRRRIDKLRFKLRPEQQARWDAAPEEDQLAAARRLLDGLSAGLPSAPAPGLAVYERELAADLRKSVRTLIQGTNPQPITLDDVPSELLRTYRGKSGDYLLRVRPAVNIWEPELRARFIDQVASVAPHVTGIPVTAQESTRLMRQGYVQGGLYSLVVVLLLLWLDLRRPSSMALALTPLFVGGGWTLGVMALVGLTFNLANLVILPLMIGIGIDIGIHMTHRHLEDGQSGADLVAGSTGRAVLLSGVTTAIGFGSLALAQHRGIHSLGALLALGVAANLLAAVLVLAPLTRLRRSEPSSSS